MFKTRTIRTYSKTQKVINYSTLFTDFGAKLDESLPVETKSEPKKSSDSKKSKITDNDATEPKLVKKKRNEKSKPEEEKPQENKENNDDEDKRPRLRVLPKRKAKENIPAPQPIATKSKKAPETSFKLFQDTIDDINDSNNSKPAKKRRTSKKKTADKKPEVEEKKITKSAPARSLSPSASSIVNSVASCLTIDPFVEPKPTQTNPREKDTENQDPKVDVKAKKPNRIMELLNDTSDMSKIMYGNKKKHTGATSTPTGLRRKPLKVSQDISIICRN